MALIRVDDHDLHLEIHGNGDPFLCMGGWGTFCHGGERNLARGPTDHYAVAIFDYRGIGESEDTAEVAATTRMHGGDAIALLDHPGWRDVHLIALVGIGACTCQEIAIARPDLARSMVNMGSWAFVDDYLRDQPEMFPVVHRDSGFYAFQKLVCVLSFLPDYYNAHHSRLLGPDGGWKEPDGRLETHSRLIDACLLHGVRGRLAQVKCPSYAIHAARDMATSPRYTQGNRGSDTGSRGSYVAGRRACRCRQGTKIQFCDLLFGFLDRVEAGAWPTAARRSKTAGGFAPGSVAKLLVRLGLPRARRDRARSAMSLRSDRRKWAIDGFEICDDLGKADDIRVAVDVDQVLPMWYFIGIADALRRHEYPEATRKASTVVALTQPLVTQPVAMVVSTLCLARNVTSGVWKNIDGAFLQNVKS